MRDLPRLDWRRCHVCGAEWIQDKRAHTCGLDEQVTRALFYGYEYLLLAAAVRVESEMARLVGVRKRAKLKAGQPDPNEFAVIPEVRALGRHWQRLVKRLWGKR